MILEKFKQLSGKEKLYFILRYGVLFAFVLCALVLIVESLLPGDLSGKHSSSVGELVDIPVNKIIEPEALKLSIAEDGVTNEVYVGQSITLMPVYKPANATYKHTIWSISDKTVAEMRSDNVTFKAKGKVTITAISEYNHSLTSSLTFNVSEVEPESISVTVPDAPLVVGESLFLDIKVLPENVTHDEYILLSDSPCIRIDGGVVIAVKEGSATVTAVSVEDYTVFDRVELTVVYTPAKTVDFISNRQVIDTALLDVGEEIDVSLSILPADATKDEVLWQASDGIRVTFDSLTQLTIKATAPGEQFLTATLARDNLSATIRIEVSGTAESSPIIDLTVDDLTLEVGSGRSPFIHPVTQNGSDAGNIKYLFSVDDPSIINVNELGLISALKTGTTMITVRPKGSDCSARATITVTEVNIRSLFIVTPDEAPAIGKPYKLTAEYRPRNATATEIVWSVDKDIAQVKFGVVEFLEAGTVIVTATAENGISTSVTLKANNILGISEIRAIGFESDETIDGSRKAVLKNNESARLSIIFSPNATYREISINSSAPDVVNVTGHTVTGLKPGSAVITVHYWDGNENISPITFDINVTVIEQKLSDFAQNWGYAVRKSIGHFGAFLVTGIFAALTFMLFIGNGPIAALLTLLSGFGLAGLTELLQMITPGRGPSFSDVVLDFQGFCISAIIVITIYFVKYIVKRQKRKPPRQQ